MRSGTSRRLAQAVGAVVLTAACTVQSPVQPFNNAQSLGDPVAASAAASTGAPPPFVFPDGCCYYNDTVVRTVVPPATMPQTGRDNFYAVSNGVVGQKGVVGVVPGAVGYHGGHWKFYLVTFVSAPYLLTSEAAVLAALAAGNVTVTRVPENDFLCPIQL